MQFEHVFEYPAGPHVRSHGPLGYSNYNSMKEWLRDEFEFRCVYCLEREEFGPDGSNRFSTDHVKPKSEYPLLVADYDNLVYACIRCNTLKGRASVSDPTSVDLQALLQCDKDGTFIARTSEGERLIEVLQLNDERRVRHRRRLIKICEVAGEDGAPSNIVTAVKELLRYPDDLPNLETMSPPSGNSRPDGILTCHFARKKRGVLAESY